MSTTPPTSNGSPVEPGARRGLRLGTKLALSFLLAALVPVMLVAALGVRVIQASLETTLRDDAERQLDVGLNLVLRAAEQLGDDLFHVTSSGDLVRAMVTGPSALAGERTTAVISSMFVRNADFKPLELIVPGTFDRESDQTAANTGIIPGTINFVRAVGFQAVAWANLGAGRRVSDQSA